MQRPKAAGPGQHIGPLSVHGVVAQQVLRPQVVCNLAKRRGQAALVDVKGAPTGLLAQGDHGVFAGRVTTGVGLDRRVDQTVNHGVAALRGGKRLVEGGAGDRVVAVRHDDQHLATGAWRECLRAQQHGGVEGRRRATGQAAEATVDAPNIVGERDDLAHVRVEVE